MPGAGGGAPLPKRHADARDRQRDAEGLAGREALAPERGGDKHRQQGEAGEDERPACGGHPGQTPVEQRDEEAELRDPEERDWHEVAGRRARVRADEEDEGKEAENANRVAEQRERGGG